jgi:hypothetical protein
MRRATAPGSGWRRRERPWQSSSRQRRRCRTARARPLIASGGAWAVAPGPAIALAIADVIGGRRSAIAYDHARLLGRRLDPDAGERRQLLTDIADDLLSPLASVVIPAGIRTGRARARDVHADGGTSQLELVAGGLELIDLPPGERRPPRSSSATPSGSAGAAGSSRSRSPAASAGCCSTCATCRSACRTDPSAGGSCSRRGRTRSGSRATDDRPGPQPRPLPDRHSTARSTSASRCGPATGRSSPRATRSCRFADPRPRPRCAARRQFAAGLRRRRRAARRSLVALGGLRIPLRRGSGGPLGELLFESVASGGWPRASTRADRHADRRLSSATSGPASRSVLGRRAGSIARRRGARRADAGVLALGAERARVADRASVLRPGSLDIGLAGTILVVGSRVDAEALTRAERWASAA